MHWREQIISLTERQHRIADSRCNCTRPGGQHQDDCHSILVLDALMEYSPIPRLNVPPQTAKELEHMRKRMLEMTEHMPKSEGRVQIGAFGGPTMPPPPPPEPLPLSKALREAISVRQAFGMYCGDLEPSLLSAIEKLEQERTRR
jgi:hypothetical protein